MTNGRIASLTFADSDQVLVAASFSQDTVCTWRLNGGAECRRTRARNVQQVIASVHHQLIIALCAGGRSNAVVFDEKSGPTFAVPKALIAAAFMPDGRSFVSCSSDTEAPGMGIDIWDLCPLLSGLYGKDSTNEWLRPIKTIKLMISVPTLGPQACPYRHPNKKHRTDANDWAA